MARVATEGGPPCTVGPSAATGETPRQVVCTQHLGALGSLSHSGSLVSCLTLSLAGEFENCDYASFNLKSSAAEDVIFITLVNTTAHIS